MKSIILIGLALILTSCGSYQLKIGSPLPDKATKLNQGLVISSSQISDQIYVFYEKGIKYTISLDKQNKINYISPEDKKFISPEGLHVGDTLKQTLAVTSHSSIKERGWAFYVRLPSGWNAAFTQGPTWTEGELKDTTIIKWFFKRK